MRRLKPDLAIQPGWTFRIERKIGYDRMRTETLVVLGITKHSNIRLSRSYIDEHGFTLALKSRELLALCIVQRWVELGLRVCGDSFLEPQYKQDLRCTSPQDHEGAHECGRYAWKEGELCILF